VSVLRPLDADALVQVALRGDHHVRLIQHKHLDHLGVDELEFDAPVQHGARGADHDLLLELHAARHWSAWERHERPRSSRAAVLRGRGSGPCRGAVAAGPHPNTCKLSHVIMDGLTLHFTFGCWYVCQILTHPSDRGISGRQITLKVDFSNQRLTEN